MQALLDFDILKAVFYRDEEVGHLGSRHSILNKKEFYTNCNFILQCDRKGNTDFLTKSGGVTLCSNEFIGAAKPFIEKYGFVARDIGVSTDVDTLVSNNVGVSCANISSGYFNPHTDNETVSVSDVGRTYSLVYDIIKNIGSERFEYKYNPPAHVSTYNNKNTNKGKTLSLFNKEYPIVEVATQYTKNTNKWAELPGMFLIKHPAIIHTDYKCPTCKNKLFISTTTNTLKCYSCRREVENDFPDWHEESVVTFTKDDKKSQYLYSWYYGAWVEKSNAVLVQENNYNFWVSKQIYEKYWKS